MKKYVISPNVRDIREINENWAFLYNSILGKPLILNEESTELLNLFSIPKTIEEVKKQCEGDPEELINSFIEHYFLIEENFNEREFLRKKKRGTSGKSNL